VTAWVCVTLPVLALNVVLIGRAAPHLAAVAAATVVAQARLIVTSVQAGRLMAAALAAVEVLLVAMPVVAGALTAIFVSYRSGFAAADWNGHRRRPRHRRGRTTRTRPDRRPEGVMHHATPHA
jgi:hypothetical protein